MSHSCSLPFPAIEVRRRFGRSFALFNVDQQPAAVGLIAAVVDQPLQQSAGQHHLHGIGFLRALQVGVEFNAKVLRIDVANSDIQLQGGQLVRWLASVKGQNPDGRQALVGLRHKPKSCSREIVLGIFQAATGR